ncbi:MAG TPA: antibiotic biosynthesis monooxygenase [Planctomycetaceae bacterium]|jgi:quinol monooxygenase YgiN|nr:antibiotic biosynthesis monooxygenase [Planctomycetaceae bacterium]
MIHVLATIHLQPGQRGPFLEEFHRLMPHVHAENGCIEYGPAIDVQAGLASPTPFRDDVVVVVEKWSDLPALKAHLVAPHMHDYRSRVKDLVKSVDLQVLEPA